MATWPYRYQLSLRQRLRRSLYEVLRDQLDAHLVHYALVESYRNFVKAGEPYPFVTKRELKPRAKVVEIEHPLQNHFLILFCEGTIPAAYKKYIRFFDSNKVTKENLREIASVPLYKRYSRNLRYFEHLDFFRFLFDLTKVDYALLIQQDPTVRRQNRYALAHFHVRIDWPLDEAAEDLGLTLRYIAKDLYERGERYAHQIQHKLFEKYGFHHVVGGRRTAAVIAAQLLRRMDFISTVYVASAESRTLVRISERGVSKYVLVRLPLDDVFTLSESSGLGMDKFCDRYLVDITDDMGVGILHVVYRNSVYAKPPEDGRLRRLRPDYQWLSVVDQLLVPRLTEFPDAPPLPYSTIYT